MKPLYFSNINELSLQARQSQNHEWRFHMTITKNFKSMKTSFVSFHFKKIVLFAIACYLLTACHQTTTKTEAMKNNPMTKGTFGYDLEFIQKHVKPVILADDKGSAQLMIIPQWQARVMTSTANGQDGFSYGWLNYSLITSGKPAEHINAFGGEERFWLGPEGGPFSLYFKSGVKQEFANWFVPAVLDTVSFDLVSQSKTEAFFHKNCQLTNYSGTLFNLEINRKITLLSKEMIESRLGIGIKERLSCVGYETQNEISNKGKEPWTEKSGALSVWMLSMLTPSPGVTIFLPYKKEEPSSTIVNDDYFGKVPSDRLIVKDGIIWFKADGKLRSKIGVPPEKTTGVCGSYDAINKTLTILWCKLPEHPSKYVNSKWGTQADSYSGDAMNSYNDGPVEDGTQMGPFYELESSSPAAFLKPGENLTHTQSIYHFEGDEDQLSSITEKLFKVSVKQINQVFNKQ
jgi:hypothetical protein